MDAVEHLVADLVALRDAQPRIRPGADEDGTVGESRQRREPALERSVAARDDGGDGRPERVRVHRGDEDRMGPRGGIGDPSEGAGAERRPLAGLDEQRTHVIAGHPGRMPAGEGAERRRFRPAPLPFRAAHVDHHRLQRAAVTPVDSDDGTGGGRRVTHARHRLVLETQLAARDRVARRDVHGGTQPDVISGDQRDAARRRSVVDAVGRRSRDRQAQPAPYAVARHGGDRTDAP